MSDLHLAYTTTPRLRALLDQWDAAITQEPSISRHPWARISLWPAARSSTVAASTAIEGNSLTLEQVHEVLSGGTVQGSAEDIRDVLNYDSALDLANLMALRPDFEWTQEVFHRLNATILRGLEDDERGEYRTQPVTVGDGAYSPPDHQRVPSLMTQLVEWLRSPQDCHPIVQAGLIHLNVVSIHPWLNGNGRTARVAGSLMFMRCNVSAPELVNVEWAIRADPVRYVTVLQHTHGARYDPERHSATEWLEYFAELSVERLDVENRLSEATANDVGLIAMQLSGAGYSADWYAVLLGARIAPFRTAEMARALGLSTARVRAMVARLCRDGWLTAVDESRARYYTAGPRLLALPLRAPALWERFFWEPQADER